uniref:Ig-like domain-containing protein n=1 Tax=Branchiostoma floridae TaxID=7739 RepID=C3YH53_BRAFL|eukprot:XP_002604278.1 hypothetical protein BRAFLDRAFT_88567 [Branchiostoma floridae]
MEMYSSDDIMLSLESKGPSSRRYKVSARRPTRKPWTKSPAFISAVVFASLAVGGIVVGVLVATGVINTAGFLPSTDDDLHGIESTPEPSQKQTTQGAGQQPTTPVTSRQPITPQTSQFPATPERTQRPTTHGTNQQPTTLATTPSTLHVQATTRSISTVGPDSTTVTALPTTSQPTTTTQVGTTAPLSTEGNIIIVGSLNTACDACTCDNHVLDGHVTDTRNAPLDAAEIYLAEKPWEVASTTNSTGRFTLTGACSQGVLLLVKRSGYFEEYANSTQLDSETSSVAVKMRVMEPPIIDENPVGKVRLVGQDVTFCCRAHGTPMPSSYEWFKDDRVLDDDVYQYNETLTLYNLQVNDTGTYKCRANSEAGAKYSTGALLTVYDNGTPMCNSTPTTKLIDLPDDCVQLDTNTTKYDIGACSRQKCAGDLGEDDKACLDTRKFCCVSVASETHTVQCSDYSLDVSVTTSCGCWECVQLTQKVSGRAFGIKNGTEIPLDQGEVIMDGQIQGYTSQTGEFELNVPHTVDHVTITFKDFYKKLVTTTKVLHVKEGIEPYYTVRMQVRPPTSPLNASETSTINLGTLPGQPPLAEVDIPPNSFFTESGDPYTGIVQASVGFIDPRNPDDFDAIQSDLTTVDEEGTQQALRTFGMFSMDFEDDVGNPVVMGGKMAMHIDPEQVNINPFDVDENGNLNTKLWSLNPSSGEWELVGNLRVGTARRGKRSQTFFIGEFEYRGYSINCDKRETTDRRCWVKVRVYDDENAAKNPTASGQRTGAQATVLTIETPAYTGSWWGSSRGLSRYQTLTVDTNGVCIETFCEPTGTEFNASVHVSHGSNHYKVLHIDDHPNVLKWPDNLINSIEHRNNQRTVVFDAFKPTTDNGPLYKYEDQSLCNEAPIGDNHIAVYNAEYEPYIFPPYEFNEDQYNQPIDELSWYNREDGQKKVCFIKVRVHFTNQNSKVEIRTKSEGGGVYSPNSGKVYGFREDRTQTDSGNSRYGFTCVEFKCPGPIMTSPGNGRPSRPVLVAGDPQSDNIKLAVVAKNLNCRYTGIDTQLSSVVSPWSEGNKVEFTVPLGNSFGQNFGIYSSQGEKKDGYDSTYNHCKTGHVSGTQDTMEDWAIEFRCYI